MPNPKVGASADPFRRTALVVNSSVEERERVCRFLSRWHYRVLDGGSFEKAVEICRTYAGNIHVLVTDFEQSDASAYDLAKSATAIRPELVVLFLPPKAVSNIEIKGFDQTADTLNPRSHDRATIALDIAGVLAGGNRLPICPN